MVFDVGGEEREFLSKNGDLDIFFMRSLCVHDWSCDTFLKENGKFWF